MTEVGVAPTLTDILVKNTETPVYSVLNFLILSLCALLLAPPFHQIGFRSFKLRVV